MEKACDISVEEGAPSFYALVALVTEAQKDKIFKEEDPILQATIIWSMMHGLSNLLIDGHLHIQNNLEALYEMSFKIIFEGMRT